MPAVGHVDEGRTRVGKGCHATGHVRPCVSAGHVGAISVHQGDSV